MKKIKLLLVLALLVLIPSVSYSIPMGEATFSFWDLELSTVPPHYSYSKQPAWGVKFGEDFNALFSYYGGVGGVTVFPTFPDVLTDGKQVYLLYAGWFGDGIGPVNWNFSKDYHGNGIDFQGYRINAISWNLDEFVYGVADIYQGITTMAELDTYTVTVDATPVPEPTTMLLLGSGLIGLAGYGRKKFFKK